VRKEEPSQLLSTFFGLRTEDIPLFRINLFKQIHEIIFHGKGGYDWDTVYHMPIWLRQFTFKNIKEFYPFAQDLLNKNRTKKQVEDIIEKWKDRKSISLMDFSAGTFFTPNRGSYSSYGEVEYACFLKGDFILNTGDFLKGEKYIGTPSMKSPIWYYWNDVFPEIIALYPEQIKLADGTNTTFDSENDDIRFEYGGEINLQIDERDKKLRNDKDYFPFEILNEKGEKLGKIDLMYRSDLKGYQISNSKVIEKGKGIGKKAYLKLRQILDKPIISDSSRSEDAENLWKSLERSNDAKYDSNIEKYVIYKKGGITQSSTPDYLKFLIG
jgi:hypothetical protein